MTFGVGIAIREGEQIHSSRTGRWVSSDLDQKVAHDETVVIILQGRGQKALYGGHLLRGNTHLQVDRKPCRRIGAEATIKRERRRKKPQRS